MKSKKNNNIWVQPHEDYVVTRFFFVYPTDNYGEAQTCSTNNQDFVKEIEQALKFF